MISTHQRMTSRTLADERYVRPSASTHCQKCPLYDIPVPVVHSASLSKDSLPGSFGWTDSTCSFLSRRGCAMWATLLFLWFKLFDLSSLFFFHSFFHFYFYQTTIRKAFGSFVCVNDPSNFLCLIKQH